VRRILSPTPDQNPWGFLTPIWRAFSQQFGRTLGAPFLAVIRVGLSAGFNRKCRRELIGFGDGAGAPNRFAFLPADPCRPTRRLGLAVAAQRLAYGPKRRAWCTYQARERSRTHGGVVWACSGGSPQDLSGCEGRHRREHTAVWPVRFSRQLKNFFEKKLASSPGSSLYSWYEEQLPSKEQGYTFGEGP
jgi:hypothetical protein